MSKSMNTTETRAWFTVMTEVLKSEGILWKDLNEEKQSEYLVKWAKCLAPMRTKMLIELHKEEK